MDELLQIMAYVQNLREGSNSPANQRIWTVHKLFLVRIRLSAESQKAVARIFHSSCSARFPGMNHGVDIAYLVWKGN